MMTQHFSIGEAASRSGLTVKTIRYYEEIGLIAPLQRKGSNEASVGRRVFDEDDIERLVLIKQARLMDFSLDQIKVLLESMAAGCGCKIKPLLKTFIESKREQISERIRDLESLRDKLDALHMRTAKSVLLKEKLPLHPHPSGLAEIIFGEAPVRFIRREPQSMPCEIKAVVPVNERQDGTKMHEPVSRTENK